MNMVLSVCPSEPESHVIQKALQNDIPAVWSLTRHTVTMPMTSKQTNLAYNFVADQVWDLFVGILGTSSCLLAGRHSVELTNRD
jgi:hypothetical protein